MLNCDDETVEYDNDRTKLLSQNSNQPTRKLHGEIGKFILPHSDNEVNHEDIELCEQRQLINGDNDVNKNGPLSPSAKVSRPKLFSKIPKRFIILILMALGNFCMYCIRMCLNVTIVAMTHSKGEQAPEFQWDNQFQGTILASLYWSYTAMQIPGGLLCIKYGGCFLLGIAIFGASVLTLATPFIVRQSVYAFIVLRVLEGAFLGVLAAAGMTMMSNWAPVYERSIFMTVATTGLVFGTVFANSLSGILAGSSWGWPSVFYFFGVQGILWFLCWLYFAYEEPNDHPNITKSELELIGKHWDSRLAFSDIPWRYILTSLPVWAIIIGNFTDCWSFYTFMISFPGYLKDVQKLDITAVGLTSSLPYVITGVCSPCWGYFIDVLRSRKYISTTNARKLSSFIGAGISGIFVIAMAYTSTLTSAIVIVTIAITLCGFTSTGPSTNIVELAPKYSGILMGIVNFACNITGFISPEVVGAVTNNGDPRQQWSIVFYVTAGVNVLGMVFYCCFASAEKQAWDEY